MGHRHIFNTAQMFDPNDEQSWKHMHSEQPYGHFANAVPAENSSLVYPVDNMSIDSIPYGGSHWNPTPRPNAFPTFPTPNLCVEMPHHQPDASGPSHDPFMHPSSVGNFPLAPESYPHQSSSSNYGAQTFNPTDEGLFDLTSNGRGPYKRKSLGVPTICERGSSSRCYNAATLPDLAMPSNMWQEKQNFDSDHAPRGTSAINCSYVGNNLPVGNEGSIRNVRSRALFDADSTLPRTNLSTALSHQTYFSVNPGDCSCPMEYMGQRSDAQMQEWAHFHAAHGRIPMPDANVFNHEANNFVIGGSNLGAPLEIGPHHNNLIASRTPVPQNLQVASGQSSRGSRSSYTQRSAPTFRGPPSSNVHWGHPATGNDGMQMNMESYPSRHSRPLSTIGWRGNDRHGRSWISSDRFRSLSDEAGIRSGMTSEGLVIADRSGMYGSRSAFDQHSDMRLDVDNMSYEDLLALGDRIGNVSTGLSEDLVSKCLTESLYCSSDKVQDEERCAICLDEYKNMDDVGTLRKCRHDFHVGCIKKWLFVKNLCPICKASISAAD